MKSLLQLESLSALSPTERFTVLALCLSFLFAAYYVLIAIYRLYFHPLAKFPGPRAAALSRNWLLEQVRQPSPEAIFEQLHKDFATSALRIGPNELHLTDPSLYKVIYSQSNPYVKEDRFYDAFKTPHTLFSETDPGLHKTRRKLLNPLFSKAGVLKLEPIITSKIKELMDKFRSLQDAGPLQVYNAYRCTTLDIISEFAFGKCMNLVQQATKPSFESDVLTAIDEGGSVVMEMPFRPVTRFLTSLIPLRWIAKIDKNIRAIVGLQRLAYDSVNEYNKKTRTSSSHPVVFDYLESLNAQDKANEAIDILIAGSDTTAFTLTTASHYILSNPAIKQKLQRVLEEEIPDPKDFPSLTKLEQIEYLWAIVKESLRMAMPVQGRLPRVVPNNGQPLLVDGKVIPPGTVIGMSAYTMHRNEQLWGFDALSYNPDRWIGKEGKSLDQNLCTFSKGARQCIGINVAHAELTLALAYVFRNFDITLKSTKYFPYDFFTTVIKDPVLVAFRAREKN